MSNSDSHGAVGNGATDRDSSSSASTPASASTPTPTPTPVHLTSTSTSTVTVAASPLAHSPEPSPNAVAFTVHAEPKANCEAAESEATKECNKSNEEKEGDKLLWYFAIGSMMNPTSLNLRNLFPRQSRPGILYGWKLVFRGGGGMGDIDPGSEEDHFHGILHQVTEAEFKHLDSIESIYSRVPVKVTCYDGTIIEAGAYKMDPAKMNQFGPDALPGERYLDIIIRGAIHFGVDPAYIEKLRKIPVQPRRKVAEYRLIPTPPDVIVPKSVLEAGTGGEGKDLLISIHGKVCKFTADPHSSPMVMQTYQWAKNRFAGQEICVPVAKVLYEPLYPIPTTYDAMPYEAKLWAEELFYGFSRAPYPPTEPYKLGSNWTVIGWLEGQKREC